MRKLVDRSVPWILREDRKIGELARLECSLARFLERQPGPVAGEEAQSLFRVEPLSRADDATRRALLARDHRPYGKEWVVRDVVGARRHRYPGLDQHAVRHGRLAAVGIRQIPVGVFPELVHR